uniref:Uncharacterized protein n=1 Tax=Arundo donax TaxID=35708 RepID=A0A0A9CA53_ARUDO
MLGYLANMSPAWRAFCEFGTFLQDVIVLYWTHISILYTLACALQATCPGLV